MRSVVLGDTGDGKNLYVSDIGIELIEEEGYIGWFNWELKGVDYNYVDNLNFIRDVDPSKKNVVGIDEVGQFGKGSYMQNLENMI